MCLFFLKIFGYFSNAGFKNSPQFNKQRRSIQTRYSLLNEFIDPCANRLIFVLVINPPRVPTLLAACAHLPLFEAIDVQWRQHAEVQRIIQHQSLGTEEAQYRNPDLEAILQSTDCPTNSPQ